MIKKVSTNTKAFVLSINKSEFPLFSLKKAPNMITISLPEDDLLALALAHGELKVKKRI